MQEQGMRLLLGAVMQQKDRMALGMLSAWQIF